MVTRVDQALQFFTGLGLTPAQAAGFVGNLQQESGRNLDPTAIGDRGASFGIAQFQGSRRRALNEFARSRGTDPSDFNTQLEFIGQEFQTTERGPFEALRAAETPAQAAQAGVKFFRPSDPRTPTRIRNALALAGEDSGSVAAAFPAQGPTQQSQQPSQQPPQQQSQQQPAQQGLLAGAEPQMANGNGIQGLLNDPLLNLGIGILAASGPSTQPVGLGQAIAGGFQFASQRERDRLLNEVARSKMQQQQQQQQAQKQFQAQIPGLLADSGLPESQKAAVGLLAQVDPAKAVGLLFGQDRAAPADIRTMEALDIPRTLEGFAQFQQIKSGAGGTKEQQEALIRQEQIAKFQREREEALSTRERNQADAKISTINSVDRVREAAQANERLRGTIGETGLGLDEVRAAAAGGLSTLTGLFGGDEQKARQVAADLQRFEQLTTTEAVQALFSGQVQAGTLTNDKMNVFLTTKPGLGKLPEVNNLTFADMLQSSLDSAEKLGIDLPERENIEEEIKRLRASRGSTRGTDIREQVGAAGTAAVAAGRRGVEATGDAVRSGVEATGRIAGQVRDMSLRQLEQLDLPSLNPDDLRAVANRAKARARELGKEGKRRANELAKQAEELAERGQQAVRRFRFDPSTGRLIPR